MTCNCHRDSNDELLPIGCEEHGFQPERLQNRDWGWIAASAIGVLGFWALVIWAASRAQG